MITGQINTLHADMCKPENPPATYGRFRAFLYRTDGHNKYLMMQNRWYPFLTVSGLTFCAFVAGLATLRLLGKDGILK